jgi:hypothetical protein
MRTVVAPLALYQQLGLGTLAHHEIHLAAIDVAKVSQFQIAPFHILLKLHPLDQMARHQVLETRAVLRHHRPIEKESSESSVQYLHSATYNRLFNELY